MFYSIFRFSLAITVGKVVARIVKKDFGGEGKEVWLFISKSGTLPYDTVYISTVTTWLVYKRILDFYLFTYISKTEEPAKINNKKRSTSSFFGGDGGSEGVVCINSRQDFEIIVTIFSFHTSF